MTCKIKGLDRGRLKIETDYMGTVHLDWSHIAGVRSARNFEFETSSGEVFYGSVEAGADPETIVVQTDGEPRTVPTSDVVYATEIKRGFFKRLEGNIDFGFNYRKTDQEINYTFSGRAFYRTKKNKTDLGYNTVLSNRNNASRAYRSVVDGNYTHFLKKRWYAMGVGRFEENDQLGLDLRTSLGGGAGRFIVQTNQSLLSVGGGVTTNRERYTTDPSTNTSIEALLNVSYDFFIHGDLGTDITSSFTVFPSLTESGRYRAELNFKYRQEVVSDLYIALSGWYSFDSAAPLALGETVRQDDYGVVTSLGWEF